MKTLAHIEATWIKLDSGLERELSSASSIDRSRILEYQIINDHPYFILCWGQLEWEIDGRCRQAVSLRRSHADWRIRRGWDLYNPNDSRFSGLSFENRARLVLDGQTGRGSEFALTLKHYGSRNQIAHGTIQKTRIDVSAFVADCYKIQSALHRAA